MNQIELFEAAKPPVRKKVRYDHPDMRIQPMLVLHEAPDLRGVYRHAANTPDEVARMLEQSIGKMDREVFVAIGLSARQWIVGIRIVTVGILNATLVHQRETYRAAVEMNAAALIVAHNHPSGDPTPSREDLKITGDLVQAGRVMGIKLQDHIIIGRRNPPEPRFYCSIRESGMVMFED